MKATLYAYLCLVVLIILTAVDQSWAWPPKFGPEFEFSSLSLKASFYAGENKLVEEEFVAKSFTLYLMKICPQFNCRVEMGIKGKWGYETRFYLDEEKYGEVYFQVSWDPMEVEIQMNPMTIDKMKSIAPVIEEFLFASAKKFNLSVDETEAGHVNLGAQSAFEDDPELFLRFYVDHANHPEWDLGTFNKDLHNAPPLSVLIQKQRDELKLIINEFYEGKFKTYHDIAKQIQRRVHKKTYAAKSLTAHGHFQALSIKTITGIRHWLFGPLKDPKPIEEQRLELRGVRGQTSYLEFIRFAEFTEKRLMLLKQEQNDHIPIQYLDSGQTYFFEEEILKSFDKELKRMGLNFEEYQILLPKNLQRAIPVHENSCEFLFAS